METTPEIEKTTKVRRGRKQKQPVITEPTGTEPAVGDTKVTYDPAWEKDLLIKGVKDGTSSFAQKNNVKVAAEYDLELKVFTFKVSNDMHEMFTTAITKHELLSSFVTNVCDIAKYVEGQLQIWIR